MHSNLLCPTPSKWRSLDVDCTVLDGDRWIVILFYVYFIFFSVFQYAYYYMVAGFVTCRNNCNQVFHYSVILVIKILLMQNSNGKFKNSFYIFCT